MKRIVSILFGILLCTTFLQDEAFADENSQNVEVLWGTSADNLTGSGTMSEALEAMYATVGEVDYIQLQSDIETDTYFIIESACTIDLNGFNVTGGSEAFYLHTADETVTFIDSSGDDGVVKADNCALNVYTGNVVVEAGVYEGAEAISVSSVSSMATINGGFFRSTLYYTIYNAGTVYINDGTFYVGTFGLLQNPYSDGYAKLTGGYVISEDYVINISCLQGTIDLSEYPKVENVYSRAREMIR